MVSSLFALFGNLSHDAAMNREGIHLFRFSLYTPLSMLKHWLFRPKYSDSVFLPTIMPSPIKPENQSTPIAFGRWCNNVMLVLLCYRSHGRAHRRHCSVHSQRFMNQPRLQHQFILSLLLGFYYLSGNVFPDLCSGRILALVLRFPDFSCCFFPGITFIVPCFSRLSNIC